MHVSATHLCHTYAVQHFHCTRVIEQSTELLAYPPTCKLGSVYMLTKDDEI